MSKKITYIRIPRKNSPEARLFAVPVFFTVLTLFTAFIVLAQESDIFSAGFFSENNSDFSSGWVKPARWYRSNAGGMALEETHSRVVAFRNQYALAVIFAHHSEIPPFLSSFYEGNYLPEIRILYENGEQTRTQWILRDVNGNTRLNAVFTDSSSGTGLNDSNIFNYNDNIENKSGFIEIFDNNSFLVTEYRLSENGKNSRINYGFNNNLLINAVVSSQENNEEYKELYADYYRYNRSLSLRTIERIFFAGIQEAEHPAIFSSDDSVLIDFPRRVMDAVSEINLGAERFNLYPEFFGGSVIESNAKIIYETDERGRILSETFYNEEGIIIWTVRNTWANNRIAASLKIEDNTELLAEYEYNQDGDKILERNFKNGVLERVVRVQGNTEIEELYINNVAVLRAVWEDGRKISETRMR